MLRFGALEKEINKGINVNEKSNEVISNWSPNNVRRLIIGLDFAIVNYFVTGPKYNKLSELVDLRRVNIKDLDLLNTEPQKYKSILQVLTTGRICSSIEEIIFCTKGYPMPLLAIDSDIAKLAGGNASLPNRFVRLRHVSIAETDVQSVAKHLEKAKPAETLLMDILKEQNVPLSPLITMHEDDWWKGVSLRPKYYIMDNDTLPKYFAKVKEAKEAQQKEELLEELNSKKDGEVIQKYLPAINAITRFNLSILERSNTIFHNAPIISKAEWANVLEHKNFCRGIRKELIKNADLVTQVRQIDFAKILKVAQANNVSQDDLANLQKFQTLLFNDILSNEEEYKRESNKAPFITSIQTLQKIAGIVFGLEVNIVHLSFAKYLTRNTPEYVSFFYDRLKGGVADLNYTRSIMEFCNRNIENGWAKTAMDKIGAKELLAEQYSVPQKNSDVNKILVGLSTAN